MDIRKLVNQYSNKIRVLEKQIEELRRKKDFLEDILRDASEMLDETTVSDMSDIAVVSDKYSNMYWPDAIILALKGGKEMTAKEVLDDLLTNGFETSSKSVKSDIYSRLKKLEKIGKVVATKEGKQLARYKLKEDKKEDPGSYMEEPGS